jgi:hypothetical protein
MSMLIGQKENAKSEAGKVLTWKEIVLAECYVCNGKKEGGVDCLGRTCILYPKMPYRDQH